MALLEKFDAMDPQEKSREKEEMIENHLPETTGAVVIVPRPEMIVPRHVRSHREGEAAVGETDNKTTAEGPHPVMLDQGRMSPEGEEMREDQHGAGEGLLRGRSQGVRGESLLKRENLGRKRSERVMGTDLEMGLLPEWRRPHLRGSSRSRMAG